MAIDVYRGRKATKQQQQHMDGGPVHQHTIKEESIVAHWVDHLACSLPHIINADSVAVTIPCRILYYIMLSFQPGKE